jgi:hypothetical protein
LFLVLYCIVLYWYSFLNTLYIVYHLVVIKRGVMVFRFCFRRCDDFLLCRIGFLIENISRCR